MINVTERDLMYNFQTRKDNLRDQYAYWSQYM
jgi:hypothetical protein